MVSSSFEWKYWETFSNLSWISLLFASLVLWGLLGWLLRFSCFENHHFWSQKSRRWIWLWHLLTICKLVQIFYLDASFVSKRWCWQKRDGVDKYWLLVANGLNSSPKIARSVNMFLSESTPAKFDSRIFGKFLSIYRILRARQFSVISYTVLASKRVRTNLQRDRFCFVELF